MAPKSGTHQSPEHIEKRAAAMRGKKRGPYKPWSEESKQRHRDAMAAKKLEPPVVCESCGQEVRPSGYSRHLQRCVDWVCEYPECTSRRRVTPRFCQDHYNIQKQVRKYGITIDQYLASMIDQQERCKICRETMVLRGLRSGKTACIDHDSKTGVFRGLLCHSCNVAIGHFADDPQRMTRAAEYVRTSGRMIS